MTKLLDKAAKRTRRHRVAVALLGALVAVVATAAVYAATSPDFTLSAQPQSETITAGDSTSYVIQLSPSNGFAGAVTLTAGSLPSNTSASWVVNGQTVQGATATVPAGSSVRSATLNISSTRNAQAGTYYPTVTAKSGSLSHSVVLTLAVLKQNTPTFTLSVNPGDQSVTAGRSQSSTVAITRTNWSGSVSLGPVYGLPAGATATLNPTATTGNSSTLTINTSATTPAGVYTVWLTGTGVLKGNTSESRFAAFTLTVGSGGDFAVSAQSTSQTFIKGGDIQADDSPSYPLTVTPSGNFSGTVTLSASGLPQGVNASFNPASTSGSAPSNSTLTLTGVSTLAAGSYSFKVTGTATIGSSQVSHDSQQLTLVVKDGARFSISGGTSGTLSPGKTLPINLTLTNPNSFDLKVSAVTVSLDGTDTSTCADSNYQVTQGYQGTITVPANQTVALSSSQAPQVGMKNLATNQNACKGATVKLRYSGQGTK